MHKRGWDDMTQDSQEVKLRDGKVMSEANSSASNSKKSATSVLY